MGLVLRHSSPRGGSSSPVSPVSFFDGDGCTRPELALQTDFQPPRSPRPNRHGSSHAHAHARRHDVFGDPQNSSTAHNSRRCRSTRQPPRLVRQDAFRVEGTSLRPQVAASPGEASPMPYIHMAHSTAQGTPRLPQQQQHPQQQPARATVAWVVLPCRSLGYEYECTYDGQDRTCGRALEDGELELAFVNADAAD